MISNWHRSQIFDELFLNEMLDELTKLKNVSATLDFQSMDKATQQKTLLEFALKSLIKQFHFVFVVSDYDTLQFYHKHYSELMDKLKFQYMGDIHRNEAKEICLKVLEYFNVGKDKKYEISLEAASIFFNIKNNSFPAHKYVSDYKIFIDENL